MPFDRDIPKSLRTMRAVELAASPVFQRDAAKLHSLGPRVLCELLADIAGEMDAGQRARMFRRMAAFRRLTPEALAAAGGDAMPAVPLRVVK